MSAGVLEHIADAVRRRLEQEPAAADLGSRAREAAATRTPRSLAASLAKPGTRVIAECKRRSPSAGWLRDPFDPVWLASEYEAGGAAAISVVTEPDFFAGDLAWIAAVRDRVRLPILRKDFHLTERQLEESVLAGADAVLLIARLLPDAALGRMLAAAAELGLETLLEVHDGEELERALALPARIIGVNARDLRSFAVDLDAAAALAARVGPDRIAVVESGVRGAGDVARLADAGLSRMLVGEHLVRAAEPRRALELLLR